MRKILSEPSAEDVFHHVSQRLWNEVSAVNGIDRKSIARESWPERERQIIVLIILYT
jgi:hypothetical protein